MRILFIALLFWTTAAFAGDFPADLQALMAKQEPGKPFTAKIPDARWSLGARGWVNLGEVALSGTPKDTQSWRVDVKVPPVISFIGADGKENGQLKVPQQNMAMEWSSATNTFSTLTGTLGGMQAVPMVDDFTPRDMTFALRNIAGKIMVDKFTAQNADMYAKAQGDFTPDAKAFRGGYGSFVLSILGMERVVAKMQLATRKPGATPRAMGNAGAATAILMMGKDNLNAATTDYTLEIKPDGRILANGVNIETVVALAEGH